MYNNHTFSTNREDIYSELYNVFRQFCVCAGNGDLKVSHRFEKTDKTINYFEINNKKYVFKSTPVLAEDKLVFKRLELRQTKLALYKALERHLKRSLPWGALTGVRPTKLAYETLLRGNDGKNIEKNLQKEYFVSKEKSRLIGRIIDNQKASCIRDENKVNFYIHIPFCPTRCYYCSFVSVPLSKQKNLVEGYVCALINDIERSAQILKELKKDVFSVYIGGGTPTVLNDEQFERILHAVPYSRIEYTCEAGRPDTITESKADLMKKYNVTRVSVNPQSLNQKTLDNIGRNHTVGQFFEAYEIIKSRRFIINTDLIAGLKDETVEDFKYTLDTLIFKLLPDNIHRPHFKPQKRFAAKRNAYQFQNAAYRKSNYQR